MLTGALSYLLGPVAGFAVSEVPAANAVTKQRVLSGMRPTGKLHLGHLVGALQNWVTLQAEYDSFHCVVDWHALTTHYADTSEIVANAYRQRGRLDWRRPRSREEHDLRPVARAGARRALSAVPDGDADPVARARADLQGTDRAAERPRPVEHRLSRLPAAAGGGHRHLRRALGAGRRGSGAAPRAVARGRAPLQQLLSARTWSSRRRC